MSWFASLSTILIANILDHINWDYWCLKTTIGPLAHDIVSQMCYDISFGVAYHHFNCDGFHMCDNLFLGMISYMFMVLLLDFKVSQSCHDLSLIQIFWIAKTFKLINWDYLWLGLHRLVKTFVCIYNTCFHAKAPNHLWYGLLQPFSSPNSHWHTFNCFVFWNLISIRICHHPRCQSLRWVHKNPYTIFLLTFPWFVNLLP